MIDEKTVRHVAKLARIKLTDGEVKKFYGQLNGVFEYMDILNEVDTEGVKETSQVTGLENVMREDKVDKVFCDREKLLGGSELPVDSNQIRVKNAIK